MYMVSLIKVGLEEKKIKMRKSGKRILKSITAGLLTLALLLPSTAMAAKEAGEKQTVRSVQSTLITVDGNDVQRNTDGNAINTFKGFGAVTCNNSSRLLMDYKEEWPEEYWEMMKLLFDPAEGAGLNHVKVELGADVNTSSGTEPATKRTEEEEANVLRGAGWHFAADAKRINPDVTVDALRWGEPNWTKDDNEARFKWYKETIDAVYEEYGLKLDYISPGVNEVRQYYEKNYTWIKYFVQQLKAAASQPDALYDYSEIKIVAADTHSQSEAFAKAMLNDPELMEAVDVISDHYSAKGNASLTQVNLQYGKEVWYGEAVAPQINAEDRINAQPEMGGLGGNGSVLDVAARFINMYKFAASGDNPAHMTRYEFQPAIGAFYQGIQYSPKHLIGAFYPWSGYYEADAGIQIVRHFMQYAQVGWEYIEGACYGDGANDDGGCYSNGINGSTNNYLTLRDPVTDDYSMIFVNNSSDTRTYEVTVKNLLKSGDKLQVWETKGPEEGQELDDNWLQNIGAITPTAAGGNYTFNLTVEPCSMVTVTTLNTGTSYTSGGNDAYETDAVLELPYKDDFEYTEYPIDEEGRTYLERRGGTPRYTTDQRGAFEVQESDDGNHTLTQVITADIKGCEWDVWDSVNPGTGKTTNIKPITYLGDYRWVNYKAQIEFKHDLSDTTSGEANYAGIGVRQVVSKDSSDDAAYGLKIFADGSYQLLKNDQSKQSGTITGFDNAKWHTMALEARENQITAYVDGEVLDVYTDTSSPVMSGRITIMSGYHNTRYDNLEVLPINGYEAYSEKLDDTSDRIQYKGIYNWNYNQIGYAAYNRTSHTSDGSGTQVISHSDRTDTRGELNKIYYYREDVNWGSNEDNSWASTTGNSYCELVFEGASFAFYGNRQDSGAAADIYIDDVKHGTIQFDTTVSDNLRYSAENLAYGTHTVRIVPTNGFTSVAGFSIYDNPACTKEDSYFILPFYGTGINLFGASDSVVLNVYVDDSPVELNYTTAKTDYRENIYWLRGLTNDSHVLKVQVVSGVLTLDGIDIVNDSVDTVGSGPHTRAYGTVNIEKNPGNGGTVTGAGQYLIGGKATLTAVPAAGYSFEGWYLKGTNTAISKELSYTFTVESADTVNYEARFKKNTVSIGTLKFAGIADQKHTGKALQPAITITDGTKTLKNGTDYTAAYSNNTNPGTAVITITGKGSYTGSVKKNFYIIAAKGKTYSKGNLKYTVTNDSAKSKTVKVTAVVKKTNKIVVIPAAVVIGKYTYKVTEINKNAFRNLKKLEKVTVGKNVKKIGAGAFFGTGKLKNIIIKTTGLSSVGKKAFTRTNANVKIIVPRSKLSAYKTLFKGKGLSKKAKITK